MVIEAVFEDIKIKHAVLKEVEAVSVTLENLSWPLFIYVAASVLGI